jgi:hypothetical protein
MQRTTETIFTALGAPAPFDNPKEVMFECDLPCQGRPITMTSTTRLVDSKRLVTSISLIKCFSASSSCHWFLA